MKVQIFPTCIVDAFRGETAIATVRVLEATGCQVQFRESHTCCGQPAGNAGVLDAARPVLERANNLCGTGTVVCPSSSCAGFLSHGPDRVGLKDPEGQTFELVQFLSEELGIQKWPPKGEWRGQTRRIAIHEACHGRDCGTMGLLTMFIQQLAPEAVLSYHDPETCCGFGGVFVASHPTLSTNIGKEKLARIRDSGADTILGNDWGCLLHLQGLLQAEHSPIHVMHVAEWLAEGLGDEE